MENLLQDVRYGLRSLLKNPGFAAIAMGVLALGIGANSAIFSVVNAVLLRPLPFKEADRLVMVWCTQPPDGRQVMGFAPPDLREANRRNQVFEAMGASYWQDYNLTGKDEPERIAGAAVSASLLPMLRVNPEIGRTFAPEEEGIGLHRVALLSHGLWERRFGGLTSAVGRRITLNGDGYTVVGVLPRGFQIPMMPGIDIFTPLAFAEGDVMNTRGNHFLRVIARMKEGVSVEQAQDGISGIMRRLAGEFPENAGIGARVNPLQEQIVGDVRPALLILLGAVGFVLLIASANVANFLLARAATREKETAIRTALGASRLRLIRQWLTESLLLGILGGGAGLLLAVWGSDSLLKMAPEAIPRLEEVSLDFRVLGFTLAISLLTGFLFGLAPALQIGRPGAGESLKEGGRGGPEGPGGRRARNLLVVAEVALALVLLIGAGLMIRSFVFLQRVDPGFDPENVLVMYVAPPEAKYPKAESAAAFFHAVLDRVEQVPGVTGAGASTILPMVGGGWGKYLTVEAHPAAKLEEVPIVQYRLVTPGYFKAMGMRLVKGRHFAAGDAREAPGVAVLNEAAARRFFPEGNPIGRRIRMAPPENLIPPGTLQPGEVIPWLTIVGVVGDTKYAGLDADAGPEVFAPLEQNLENPMAMFLAVRAAAEPTSLIGAVRSQVLAVDRDQPIAHAQPMEQLLSDSVSPHRFNLVMMSLFGALALLLSAAGIYGVIAYSVTRRTREIGVRMALGARSADILGMVVREGMLLAAAGLAIGLTAAFVLTRVMSGILFGVSPTDPATFAAIPLLLSAAAFLACYLPARRATRVDPMVALRCE